MDRLFGNPEEEGAVARVVNLAIFDIALGGGCVEEVIASCPAEDQVARLMLMDCWMRILS